MNFKFVGREGYYREGELYLLGQRWYDSSVGRFISRDPISYAGGINLYVYVNNNPFTKTDPNGLAWWDPTSRNPTTYCGATKTGPGPVTSCADYCCKKHDECLAKSGYHWWHIERCEVRACHKELLKCWNMCFILKLLEVQVKMELE
jgi:RHS repeat-associated protein